MRDISPFIGHGSPLLIRIYNRNFKNCNEDNDFICTFSIRLEARGDMLWDVETVFHVNLKKKNFNKKFSRRRAMPKDLVIEPTDDRLFCWISSRNYWWCIGPTVIWSHANCRFNFSSENNIQFQVLRPTYTQTQTHTCIRSNALLIEDSCLRNVLWARGKSLIASIIWWSGFFCLLIIKTYKRDVTVVRYHAVRKSNHRYQISHIDI